MRIFFVGQHTGDESGTIVSTKADKHDSNLWNCGLGRDLVCAFLNDLLLLSLIEDWHRLLIDVDHIFVILCE